MHPAHLVMIALALMFATPSLFKSQYTLIKVETGDSVQLIASQYRTNPKEVERLNKNWEETGYWRIPSKHKQKTYETTNTDAQPNYAHARNTYCTTAPSASNAVNETVTMPLHKEVIVAPFTGTMKLANNTLSFTSDSGRYTVQIDGVSSKSILQPTMPRKVHKGEAVASRPRYCYTYIIKTSSGKIIKKTAKNILLGTEISKS